MSSHEPDGVVENRIVIDEAPPFLGRWSRVYRFVLIYLACVIAAFYWFTMSYKP